MKEKKEAKEIKIYSGKTSITLENAAVELEKILTKYEIAEMPANDADMFLNKIRFEKLYLKDSKLYFVLSQGINRGGNNIESTFEVRNPEQSAFTDHDIDLVRVVTSYMDGGTHSIDKNSMAKIACIFLGIQPEFSGKMSIKDVMNIFTIGLLLFFAS